MAGEGRTEASFLRTALVLWVLALAGALAVLPYVATLEQKTLAAATARTGLGLPALLAISMVQTSVMLAVAVGAGLWAARRLGLRTPLIGAALTRSAPPAKTPLTLLISIGAGLAMGLLIIVLDKFVFAPMPSVAVLMHNAGGAARPAAWQGFLASFYGALDEEILMRLGLMSLLALGLRSVVRMLGAGRDVALPSGVFWTANIAAAVLFGLAHLPATAALAPLTPALVIRAIVLNGVAGLAFGVLYRRFGLEWAMAAHFCADLVLHVAVG